MQRKQTQRELSPAQNIMATILQSIPKDADVTKIDYEGPRIAIYTKNPKYLMEHNEVISNMVNVIKKRIVVRTEESIRKTEEESRQILSQMLPKEAELGGTFFDTATGEMIVDVKRPWLLNNPEAFNMPEIVSKTGWRVRIRKATASQSSTIQTINYNLKISSTERSKHLRQVGEQIFRPKLSEDAEVSLMTLGGFSQVGRSCMLLTTHESKILIDCGINPG
ncbi:MAG TPA: beta-CASP ribonuclease aCPSF1, partial [Candidatus Nitrosotalea sp.]|nr:beta-CASP ribonuclease aCPSF1 [Candidatus Nitrosotalea sp.]